MKLTNYQKFIVEKFKSLDPPISKEEFCKTHKRVRIEIEDFVEWVSLYENSKNIAKSPSFKSRKKNKGKKLSTDKNIKITNDEYIEKLRKERNHKTHLSQIRYLKNIVRTGEVPFSKDTRRQKQRISMFLEKENPYKIYKLAYILAENLNDSEYKIELLLKELKRNHIEIPNDFFNYQFINKNSASIESYEKEKIDTSSVVYEINPANNNKIKLKNKIEIDEDLQLLCKKSVNNLQKALASVYKIMESM
jgi:hypothetical protein